MSLEFVNDDKGEWSLDTPFGLIDIEIHIVEEGLFQVHFPNAKIRELYKKDNNGLRYETFGEAKEVATHIYKDVIKREYETHFTTTLRMGESIASS